jgi:uncharacterized protein (UPF0332 family)
MIVDNREDFIKYRFQRAYKSFDEALIMAKNDRWNAVINRLYYSCYYAVIAVLLKSNIETQTHDGARTQFSLHYIKTGKVDKKFGKLFTKMFDFRQKGDYGDLYDYDEIIVKPLIDEVQNFIKELERFVI